MALLLVLGDVAWGIMCFALDLPTGDRPDLRQLQSRSPSGLVLLVVVLAPLLETLALALAHRVVCGWLRLGVGWFAALGIPLWGWQHGWIIPPTVAFVVFSYQYVAARRILGRARSVAWVAATHAANNALLLMLQWLTEVLPSG